MKTVAEMSVEELKELVRQVIAEQREYFLDEEVWLVFTSEEAYVRYLERHPDKMPSELKACFIDEKWRQGLLQRLRTDRRGTEES